MSSLLLFALAVTTSIICGQTDDWRSSIVDPAGPRVSSEGFCIQVFSLRANRYYFLGESRNLETRCNVRWELSFVSVPNRDPIVVGIQSKRSGRFLSSIIGRLSRDRDDNEEWELDDSPYDPTFEFLMVNVARDERRRRNSLLCSDSSNRRIEFKSRERDSDLRLCHWSITSNPTTYAVSSESSESRRRLLNLDDSAAVARLSNVDEWRSYIVDPQNKEDIESIGFCIQVFSLRANKYYFLGEGRKLDEKCNIRWELIFVSTPAQDPIVVGIQSKKSGKFLSSIIGRLSAERDYNEEWELADAPFNPDFEFLLVNVARDDESGRNSLLCSDNFNKKIEFKSRERDSDLILCHWSISSE